MLSMLDAGDVAAARALSDKLVAVVSAAFGIVAKFPHGNAFSNANKTLDHWMAFGSGGDRVPPPLLYSGVRLPAEFIEQGGEMLRASGLMPERGYLG
jgi:hypothetical protein